MRRVGVNVLQRDWTYQATSPDPFDRVRRFLARFRLQALPNSAAIVPITEQRPRWVVYFIYLPNGCELDNAHRFSIERLRASGAGLTVVCAAPSARDVPVELRGVADAIYWKALRGFDFSGYGLALYEVARSSPGADVMLLNDSAFGPFDPLDKWWPSMNWDLTGFTAHAQVQNHVQSYAFHLKNVTAERLASLGSVFFPNAAFDDYEAVVLRQETRLASVAAQSMTVGALWYAGPNVTIDPSLYAAVPLVEAGFPFLKRGLLSKHAGIYPADALVDVLERHDHPVDGLFGP
jgi:lipopolysaccharide biosynthesis protein